MNQDRFAADLPEAPVSPVPHSERAEDSQSLAGATEIASGERSLTSQGIGYLRWVIGEMMEHGKQHVRIEGRTYGIGYLQRLLDVATQDRHSTS